MNFVSGIKTLRFSARNGVLSILQPPTNLSRLGQSSKLVGARCSKNSKFKRRSIVYTPLLLYSYTPNERLLPKLLNSQTPLKMGQEAGYSYLSLITSPFSLGKAPTLLTKDYCPNSHTPKRVGNMILSCNYYSFLCRNRKKYGKKSKKYHIFLSEYSIFAN